MSPEGLIAEALRRGWGTFIIAGSLTLVYPPDDEPPPDFSTAWKANAAEIAMLLALFDAAEQAADRKGEVEGPLDPEIEEWNRLHGPFD